MAGLASGGEVAVTNDGAGIAEALVERFTRRGYQARVIANESELSENTRVVIALDGLREFPEQPQYDQAQDESCRAVFRLARAYAERAAQGDCVFVSVQDCGGDFGLSGDERALLGSLAGLVKTASQEWPQASLKAIDLQRANRNPETLARCIEHELFQGGPELEVGLRTDGRRTTLRSVLRAVSTPAAKISGSALPENAVVVCSGGARGVTAATMIALAQANPTRFVLLGRTPLSEEPTACHGVEGDAGLKKALLADARAKGEKVKPAELGRTVRQVLAQREIRETIATIIATGGDAVYLAVDVTDAEQLRVALDDIRQRWGSIDAVVHGAGVVADKLIAEKTDEQFNRVWNTKVSGIRALLQATGEDKLRAIVMFASVAGRSGNVGQCDYAMANEALNKVAANEARRRGADCVVKSLNWGPWEAGMVTPSLKAYFEQHGVPLIPLKRGGEMLLEELNEPSLDSSGEARIEIVLGGPPQQASIAGDDAAAQQLDVFVDQHSHPYLSDHSIDGTVVLPLVMVLEWFSRAAEAFAPSMRMHSCEKLRVFRGVQLDGFRTTGDGLRISAKAVASSGGNKALELVLSNPHDARIRHYAATLVLRKEGDAPDSKRGSQAQNFGALDGVVYGDALFHGPAFQVLGRDVQAAAEGAAAQVRGLRAMNWTTNSHADESWRNDPALLDGGLQLALLWSQQRLGGYALPTGVARYQRYQAGAFEGPIQCQLRGEADGDMTGISHIEFIDANGQLIAEMEGVETHKRP